MTGPRRTTALTVRPSIDARRTIGVVIPMYRTASQVAPLLERIDSALGANGVHVVMVDDSCPDGSAEAVRRADRGGICVTSVAVHPNIGQHAAVMLGLHHAEGDIIIVMDGDLQDRPEDVLALVRAVQARPAGAAVCAARSGRYERVGRRVTARIYRISAHLCSRGRIPRNAGMFLAMDRTALAAVVNLADPFAPLLPSLARAGARISSIPIERDAREIGTSSYGSWRRVRVAVRGLATLSPAAPALARRHRRRWDRRNVQVSIEHFNEALHPSEPGARP